MNSYTTGATVRVTATFTSNGSNVDPSTVTCKVRTPAGVTTSYTYAGGDIIKSSTGVYYYDIDVSQDGTWTYRFSSTGSGKAANEGKFFAEGELD